PSCEKIGIVAEDLQCLARPKICLGVFAQKHQHLDLANPPVYQRFILLQRPRIESQSVLVKSLSTVVVLESKPVLFIADQRRRFCWLLWFFPRLIKFQPIKTRHFTCSSQRTNQICQNG